ncbi:MAG TPA: histidine phosphatase family protein [Ramlibacter sp.]|nr:histidine phosphatase family protein [Ramlibacter sp.]
MNVAWPSALWIVRHGQSAGNVARDQAEEAGAHVIDIGVRDIDVPLSQLGEQQARSLGWWFAQQQPQQQPQVVLCSPYVRARETARFTMDALGERAPRVRLRTDERLREKEFGILDRLTVHGIRHKHPELSEQRAQVGKFYFRPPGGESWCDVILRLRSVLEMVCREHADERVLVVAHQVIVNCMRYLLEELDEKAILGIDRLGDVPNCGVTSYQYDAQLRRMALVVANFTAPMRQTGTPVTAEPDAPVAAKP